MRIRGRWCDCDPIRHLQMERRLSIPEIRGSRLVEVNPHVGLAAGYLLPINVPAAEHSELFGAHTGPVGKVVMRQGMQENAVRH